MSGLSTHVLDTARGRPAAGVPVLVERRRGDAFIELHRGVTDQDGRAKNLVATGALEAGDYRITFDTAAYFAALGQKTFYPSVAITFTVAATEEHHHVPLLVSPFGYSTYRGS